MRFFLSFFDDGTDLSGSVEVSDGTWLIELSGNVTLDAANLREHRRQVLVGPLLQPRESTSQFPGHLW